MECDGGGVSGGMLAGQRLGGKYLIGGLIGQGRYGKVKLGVDTTTGGRCAVKIVPKQMLGKSTKMLNREIVNLKKLKHVNVVHLLEVLATAKRVYFVFELCPNGELFDRVAAAGRFSEAQARFYFGQLLNGLAYCHAVGVAHRDLKPENLLLDAEDNLKIADFGFSGFVLDNAGQKVLMTTVCGSPNYVAPEILTASAGQPYEGEPADVWSAGVILYFMLSGCLPFDALKTDAIFEKIKSVNFVFPPSFPAGAADLVKRILVANPRSRLQIAAIHTHAWLQQGERRASRATDAAATAAGAPSRHGGFRNDLSRSGGASGAAADGGADSGIIDCLDDTDSAGGSGSGSGGGGSASASVGATPGTGQTVVMIDDATPGAPRVAGYLRKKNRTFGWKRRFFVLNPPYFEMYKVRPDADRGTADARPDRRWDLRGSAVCPDPTMPCTFRCGETLLCAPDVQAAQLWLDRLVIVAGGAAAAAAAAAAATAAAAALAPPAAFAAAAPSPPPAAPFFGAGGGVEAEFCEGRTLGRYVLGRELGCGAIAQVHRAMCVDSRELVAVKTMDIRRIRSLEMGELIKREMLAMQRFRHPNIVELKETLATNDKLHFVLELCTGGELLDIIATGGPLTEGRALRYFQQLVAGLGYCHAMGVAHRDLKLQNLLIDADDNLKIADFGLCNFVKNAFGMDTLLKTMCGTPNYVAPEVLSSADSPYRGEPADIWSCGVILYTMLAGRLPFDDRITDALYAKIRSATYSYPSHGFPPGAADLVQRLLVVDPAMRLDLAGIMVSGVVTFDFALCYYYEYYDSPSFLLSFPIFSFVDVFIYIVADSLSLSLSLSLSPVLLYSYSVTPRRTHGSPAEGALHRHRQRQQQQQQQRRRKTRCKWSSNCEKKERGSSN